MEVFTLGQIAGCLSEPYTTLDGLVKQWGLNPSIRASTGKGGERLYSERDALACIVAFLFHRRGISQDTIKKAIHFCLNADLAKRLSRGERFLVANNHQLFLALKEAQFVNPSGLPAAVAVVDVQAV